MAEPSREFQIFVKPAGPVCNLACRYCYYVQNEGLYPKGESFRMPDDVLERYIVQHIAVCPDPVIRFSWHGGEPTILGLDYFRKVVTIQRKHQPRDRVIANGIQTNGTLLDDEWCRFLAAEGFTVGLSLDGPQEMHDRYRLTPDGKGTHERAMRGYRLLWQHGVPCEILCVVNAHNVRYPLEVYQSFKQIEAGYVSFLPLVEREPDAESGVSDRTVPSEAWGAFLCAIFDEWRARDIGRVKVQVFEEAVRPAFGQEHTLCVFRKTCGGVPVIEHNGDFFSCDHFVDAEHRLGNIRTTPLIELLDSPKQKAFGQAKFDTLPRCCRECDVLAMCHGGCPKDRFLRVPPPNSYPAFGGPNAIRRDWEGDPNAEFCPAPEGRSAPRGDPEPFGGAHGMGRTTQDSQPNKFGRGTPGLNYLCAGYHRFFTHCQPFVAEVAALWRKTQVPSCRVDRAPKRDSLGAKRRCASGRLGSRLAPPKSAASKETVGQAPPYTNAKTGRNDPCPCGSGRKYKSCCMPR